MAFVFYPLLGVLLFTAFALLALTQFPHRRATDVEQLPPRRGVQIRVVASLLLCVVLALAVRAEGGGFGFLLWVSLMSMAACAVSFVLGWWPGLLAPLARVMLLSHFSFSSTHLPPETGGRSD